MHSGYIMPKIDFDISILKGYNGTIVIIYKCEIILSHELIFDNRIKWNYVYFSNLNIGGEALEFAMNKIMSIDKDAEKYRKGIDELLKEKQDEFETTIKHMRASFQEESKNIKSDIYNEKLLEADSKAKIIRKEKEVGLNNINTKYQSNKLELIEVVFNRIIKSL